MTIAGFLPNYSKRDPQELLALFKQNMSRLTEGQWTDFTHNDIGYAMMAAFVELGDLDAFFCDANLAECFLSSAQLRESVVRIAKMLGYPVGKPTPASVEVKLNFPAFGQQLVIPQDSLWSIAGVNFIVGNEILIQPGQTTLNVGMLQGTFFTVTYTAPGTNWWRFSIPGNSANLKITVNGVEWTQVDSFIGVESPQVYKVYEEPDGSLTVLFGANINSYAPTTGSTVVVEAILTNGFAGNTGTTALSVKPISVIRTSGGADVTNAFSGTTLTIASGGADREDTDSIRAKAPGIYQTQGRLVTKLDYEAFIDTIPGIQDSQVVGGQDVNDYGTVHIILYGDDPYNVSPDLLRVVLSKLVNQNVLTVIPKITAAAVTEVDLVVTAYILPSVNNISSFENNVRTAIQGLFDSFKIGDSLYGSELDSVMHTVAGGLSFDWTAVVRSYTKSTAGLISIQTIKNPNLTSVTLTDSTPTVLFTGDGTSFLVNGFFKFPQAQNYPDQRVTLEYTNLSDNVLSQPGQIIILKNLTINSLP